MNGTGRTSRNKKSKQQHTGGKLSKKQQAILNAPVKLGDEVLVTIHGIGSSGEGVGRVDDFTVFVPFALPGETVKVSINMVKKTYATGKLIDIVTPADNRIEPTCELYGVCGGCQLQHITYEGQLSLKTQKVKDVIERIGHQNPNLVKPALGPKEPWAYRNKMQMPVGGTRGDIKMGFYAMGSHDIVQGTNCPIQDDGNNTIAQVCYDIAKELDVEPYDEHTGKGVLRHVIGIEIVEPAIINARENARNNGYDNTEFIVADAAVEMPKLYKAGVRPDVIVFDPIRAGCKEEVLTSAAGMEPKRIVYVSCNPATMARDIEILTHYGYELQEVQPVDMFPMTAHVEAVALLTRSEAVSNY